MKWVFELPTVNFERPFLLGQTEFWPPGAARAEVVRQANQRSVDPSWEIAHEQALEMTSRWSESSALVVSADEVDEAKERAEEAMAVLRFLLRELVRVNVDDHRIGLAGEVDLAVREYLVLPNEDRVAAGWFRVDGPVDFPFNDERLTKWEHDARIRWLAGPLSIGEADRSELGQRIITALRVLDDAFLSKDPVTRVVLLAVAVETLLSDSASSGPRQTPNLRIAQRAAFLTCWMRCARWQKACPYTLGFRGNKHLLATAQEWATTGEWRCSAFLNIVRPPEVDGLFPSRALFNARNEAVHEGRTSLADGDIRQLRSRVDEVIGQMLAWAASVDPTTIRDLDLMVIEGAIRLGVQQASSR